jgi:glycosyltransferase involved in cell wall biosynthesis
MSQDLISVIIPVYNAEKYLSEAINSVLAQSHTDLEIIAVDDGSTDSSTEILHSYGRHVKALSQENAGAAAARNAGIARIISDATTFDSDDQDCYPRGITLTLDRHRPEWKLLKSLEEEISWLSVDQKSRRLRIHSNLEIPFRLTESAYQSAIAYSLNVSGISCYADVHWRG